MSMRLDTFSDITKIADKKRVFIYGAGKVGAIFLWAYKRFVPGGKVLGFIDSTKNGNFCGYRKYSLDEFMANTGQIDYDLIIICSMYAEQIIQTLKKRNITKYRSFIVATSALTTLCELEKRSAFLTLCRSVLMRILRMFCVRKKSFVFAGEYGGRFTGNAKYLYHFMWENKQPCCWMPDAINGGYVPEKSVLFGTVKAWFLLLFSRAIIVDSPYWNVFLAPFFQAGVPVIQLWHGVGFKKIERMLMPNWFDKALMKKERKLLLERFPKYNIAITTSSFYAKEVFAPAFGMSADDITVTGYPRNDVFYRVSTKSDMVNCDTEVFNAVLEKKKQGYKILLYAPTFRDVKRTMDINTHLIKKMDDFMFQHKICLVIKAHGTPGHEFCAESSAKKYIYVYDNVKDVYPLLACADLLITDYSSIYVDYLHAKRPVVFYAYDIDEYVRENRDIQFSYDEMTPGPKAKNGDELKKWVKHFLVDNKDGFENERERILNLAFKYKDGNASERIWKEMLK